MTAEPAPQTPSDLKWLLNERASLLGAGQALAQRAQLARAKLEKLEHQADVLRAKLAAIQVARQRVDGNATALEVAISIAYRQANPDAVGPVKAWAGRYGERGALTAFIGSTLRTAAPQALTMTVLIDMAAAHFRQEFNNPLERRSFRKSVRSALAALSAKGAIEALHDGSGGSHGRWQAVAPGASFTRLSEEAQARGGVWP